MTTTKKIAEATKRVATKSAQTCATYKNTKRKYRCTTNGQRRTYKK
ncbi:MAG: hypothetical protein JWQ96_2789 [Segetibacter sp.]|nr:hypothetical protein [Segetibacter sp.]